MHPASPPGRPTTTLPSHASQPPHHEDEVLYALGMVQRVAGRQVAPHGVAWSREEGGQYWEKVDTSKGGQPAEAVPCGQSVASSSLPGNNSRLCHPPALFLQPCTHNQAEACSIVRIKAGRAVLPCKQADTLRNSPMSTILSRPCSRRQASSESTKKRSASSRLRARKGGRPASCVGGRRGCAGVKRHAAVNEQGSGAWSPSTTPSNSMTRAVKALAGAAGLQASSAAAHPTALCPAGRRRRGGRRRTAWCIAVGLGAHWCIRGWQHS